MDFQILEMEQSQGKEALVLVSQKAKRLSLQACRAQRASISF